MSDTNTNTDTNDDAIQKRKNQSTGNADVGGFIKNFAFSMVGIILFIIFGTSWLYIAKLSTAKTIPIDTVYEPYTCEKNSNFGSNDGKPIKVPMNTFSELDFKGLKFWGEPIGKWEQEATFASQGFIKSFNHSFISNLRKKTDNPVSASNFDKFKSILVNNVVGTGFWLYDKISMPDGVRMLPDSLKIVIYGLFGLMFFPFFWICNGMASFYYTIRTLFNGEKTSPDNPNEGGYDGGLFDGVDALKNGDSIIGNVGKMFLRGLVWIPIWFIIIPLLSMFVFPAIGTFYPFFKMLFSAGYKLKEYDPFKADKQTDSKSCLDFIKDNLIYKRTLILVFAILNLFTCANTYLGAQYFAGVVLATILAVIFGNIFVNTEPDDATMISVKAAVVEELEKPAAVDDDDCGPFQVQVIKAWTELKASNQGVSDLIDKYPNYSNIHELKNRKAHIIKEFKKLDGKQPPDNVMVTNFESEPPTVTYNELYSDYTNFIKTCQTEAQEQARQEQARQEQARQEQAEADRVAAENVKSATGGGSSSSNNNNSSSVAVKQTNLASNIEESPVQLGENRPSAETPGVKTNPVKIEKGGLQNFIDARASPIAPSGGSRSSPVAAGGSNVGDSTSAILLNNVTQNNPELVKNALSILKEQEINVILALYKKELENKTTTEDKIEKIQKYLPMIIEKQRQLNGKEPLSEDKMTAYITEKFPTATEISAKNTATWVELLNNELAELNAAKTGGGSNPNPQPQLPAGDSKQSFAFQPLSNDEPKKVMTEVMNAVTKRIAMDKKINLTVLPIGVLNSQVTKATRDFVNTKGSLNKILYNNMNLLLNEKYKRDGKSNEVDAELKRILEQQTLPVLMTGGSKGKNKTLKNRRQRFNIRLV